MQQCLAFSPGKAGSRDQLTNRPTCGWCPSVPGPRCVTFLTVNSYDEPCNQSLGALFEVILHERERSCPNRRKTDQMAQVAIYAQPNISYNVRHVEYSGYGEDAVVMSLSLNSRLRVPHRAPTFLH